MGDNDDEDGIFTILNCEHDSEDEDLQKDQELEEDAEMHESEDEELSKDQELEDPE